MNKKEASNICLIELAELGAKMFQADNIVYLTLYENYMLDVAKLLHDMEITSDDEHTELIGLIYNLYKNRSKEV